MKTDILSLKHITKEYPGVKALDDVSISFRKGEVHALVGENGAGKSTFIKTISGAIHPTSGTIEYEGKEYSHLNPAEAINMGIAVVYQELIQFEAMTVSDNLFMGLKDEHGVVINDRDRARKTAEILEQFDCHVSPYALVRELSIANRQIVELAKAMMRDAKVVIMDEPTAAITVQEQEKLYEVVHNLRNQGITVIYISHRLEELFRICDRVSVLRDGQYVTTVNIEDTDRDGLIRYMVGRELTSTYPEKKPASDEVVLEVEDVSGNGVKNISFKLHKGEILGFAGLVGAGRTELMHLIYGAAKKTSGTVKVNGKEVNLHSPTEGMKIAGVGMIPEDRKFQGCFIDKPIYWNISISSLENLSTYSVINKKKEMQQAKDYRERLRIKTPFLDQLTSGLSGGNQQKVVIAKAMAAEPNILIFDEPTRGIDIGARHEIYLLMNELAEQGKSILMVSSDMEELLGMSERLIVLHEGEQMGELSKEEFSQERVLQLASGV